MNQPKNCKEEEEHEEPAYNISDISFAKKKNISDIRNPTALAQRAREDPRCIYIRATQ